MTDLERHLSAARVAQVPVRVAVELGRCHKPLGDAVRLAEGDIVELDREPHEPIDVYVDGLHYATGRLVIVNGDWAVRLEQVNHHDQETSER